MTESFRPLIFAVMLALVLGVPAMAIRAAAESEPEKPSIYLTWQAPFGQPRAADTLSADCDSTHADTLWLSFDPGHASPTFLAVSADIVFHPAVGDTLGPFWGGDDEAAKRWIKVESEPNPGLGYPMPYRTNGSGGWLFKRDGRNALIRWIYATPYGNAVGITRQIFVAARIIMRHTPALAQRCQQPICIEWAESEITYDIGPARNFVHSGPNRFVSLNSPGGAVCEPYRRAARLHGWKP